VTQEEDPTVVITPAGADDVPSGVLAQNYGLRARGRGVLGQDCGEMVEGRFVIAGRLHLDELRQVRYHVGPMGMQEGAESLIVCHDLSSLLAR
jgi:hypothetical protein